MGRRNWQRDFSAAFPSCLSGGFLGSWSRMEAAPGYSVVPSSITAPPQLLGSTGVFLGSAPPSGAAHRHSIATRSTLLPAEGDAAGLLPKKTSSPSPPIASKSGCRAGDAPAARGAQPLGCLPPQHRAPRRRRRSPPRAARGRAAPDLSACVFPSQPVSYTGTG